MAKVTFQILDGVDKGRVFRDLPTPVTIGREEGNSLRLNDERVSRFHAKVQLDQGDLILTDLDSTNGTRVNGNVIQIHRLRLGDCISIGRSTLLFGSTEEIAERLASLNRAQQSSVSSPGELSGSKYQPGPTKLQAPGADAEPDAADLRFDLNEPTRATTSGLFIGTREFPPLPMNLSPSQAARIAEIFDLLHRALTQATEHVKVSDDGKQVVLDYGTWQKLLFVEMLLARYHRAITDPDSWD